MRPEAHISFPRVIGMTAVLVAVCLGLFHRHELNMDERAKSVSDAGFIGMAEDALQREFQFTVEELDELVGSAALQGFLATGSKVDRTRVEATFLNAMRSAKVFDQVRMVRSNGVEVARVDLGPAGPQVVPEELLQDKSTRGYFTESIDLETGHLYVSQLDFNVERGASELPHKPVLRFATPVDDPDGKRVGVIVINLLAHNVLDRVTRLTGNHGTVQLLNENGEWLFSEEPGLTRGGMFPDEPSLPKSDPIAWQAISQQVKGRVRSQSGLVTFARIHPLLHCMLDRGDQTDSKPEGAETPSYSWYMLTQVSATKHHAAVLATFREGALQWLLLIVMLAPGAWLFVSTREKQIAATQELARSERRLASLTESIPDAILTVGEAEKIVTWNRSANDLFGLAGRDITGMPLSWLVRDTEPRGLPRLLSMPPGETREMLGLHADGKDFPLEIAAGQWEDAGSSFTSLIARDTTRRAESESHEAELRSRLDQAHKLEAVGQLASGIAHEINTPTQFVGDNTRFLQESFTDVAGIFSAVRKAVKALEAEGATSIASDLKDVLEEADAAFLEEEIPKALEQSIAGIDRVARIVRAMKEFAHPGQEAKAPVDLNHCIESTVTVATSEWRYACEMHLDLDESLPPVLCHAGEINQAVLNMVVNASHAVAERLKRDHSAKGNIWISTKLAGAHAEIRIRDDGAGIPEGVREKIFNPFFTTKEVGEGSGQGLAIAHNVVTKKHAGTLTFETRLKIGTTFILRIPMVPTTHEALA